MPEITIGNEQLPYTVDDDVVSLTVTDPKTRSTHTAHFRKEPGGRVKFMDIEGHTEAQLQSMAGKSLPFVGVALSKEDFNGMERMKAAAEVKLAAALGGPTVKTAAADHRTPATPEGETGPDSAGPPGLAQKGNTNRPNLRTALSTSDAELGGHSESVPKGRGGWEQVWVGEIPSTLPDGSVIAKHPGTKTAETEHPPKYDHDSPQPRHGSRPPKIAMETPCHDNPDVAAGPNTFAAAGPIFHGRSGPSQA